VLPLNVAAVGWVRARAPAPRVAHALGLLAVAVLAGGAVAVGTDWSTSVIGWLVLAVTFAAVGSATAARVPGNAFGWVLLAVALTSAVTVSLAGGEVSGVVEWLRAWVAFVPVQLLPVALLVFPTGRLPGDRWRPAFALAVAAAVVASCCLAAASAITPDPLGLFAAPGGHLPETLLTVVRLGALGSGIALVLGVFSLLARLRSTSDVERRQVLCLLLGGLALFFALAVEVAGFTGAWIVGAAAVPVAAGAAIVWHRLYDLDLFVNRSVVYLGLSASLLAGFGAVIWVGDHLLGSVLPERAWALVGAGAVALALEPLRRRLQRSVDRVLYGSRSDPYAVMTALGRDLQTATPTATILDDVAEAVARSLALPYVAIEVVQPGGEPRLVEWGRRHREPIALPLVYRADYVGRLLVAPRTVRGALSDRDTRLLGDVAHSVALTVHAVELSTGLQLAREQLVTAREEERRRLRRDLHDGLGPALAAMVMQLDAASNTMRRDPGAVEPILVGLRTQAQAAVADIRQLVYALRPPALDELGLVGAIRDCADRFAVVEGGARLDVSFDVPSPLRALPAAVEVAGLRIAQEAITNVARHARARSCRVSIAAGAALEIVVEDDGRGLADDHTAGVGLASMRERAAEVGGSCTITAAPGGAGTLVRAILPLP
jgi:signal transduction histidine kinase